MNKVLKTSFIIACVLISIAMSQCSINGTVTKEDALNLAAKIEQSVKERDPSFLDNLQDTKALAQKVKYLLRSRQLSAFQENMILNLAKNTELGITINNTIGECGTFNLLKQYTDNDVQHLLFRIKTHNGFSYCDLELVKINFQVKISDTYSYLKGETYSKTIASFIETSSDLNESESQMTKNFSLIRSIQDLISSGNAVEAMELANQLPKRYKTTRWYRMREIDYDSKTKDTVAFFSNSETYLKDYPNAPEINMYMFDINILRKKYDEGLYAINKLDNYINKDPMLDYYRGIVYFLNDKNDSASFYFEKMYKAMPGFPVNYSPLIMVYMRQGRIKDAQKFVKIYKKMDDCFRQKEMDEIIAYSPQLN